MSNALYYRFACEDNYLERNHSEWKGNEDEERTIQNGDVLGSDREQSLGRDIKGPAFVSSHTLVVRGRSMISLHFNSWL